MNIEQKKNIVAAMHAKFTKAQIVILTDYKGLNVTTMNALRRKLREGGVEYRVVKNSLLIRASENTDVAVIKDYFKGPSGVAYCEDDPVAPAKILMAFAKENKALEIKTGVMNGKVLDHTDIKALSALPPRDILLGQVLSAMNGVPSALVRVLSGVTSQFLNVLTAIKEQKESA
ncbi:50S ribosomal protein L10 [Desulfococcaceae bacterium HSG7]|nr:50S ribosomal protein L10 [Desulfococcaceae bacterium HSG7]